jgi:hypothetical protein
MRVEIKTQKNVSERWKYRERVLFAFCDVYLAICPLFLFAEEHN